jgi:hypothetical protein
MVFAFLNPEDIIMTDVIRDIVVLALFLTMFLISELLI